MAEPVLQGAGTDAEWRVIHPRSRGVRLSHIWRTAWVVRVLAIRDFKARYKQSALGPLWLLVEPLATLAAFTVIFNGVSVVDTRGVPYELFALVGITVWTYFQPSMNIGVRAFLSNRAIIQSVAAPRIAFVLATLVGSLPQLVFTVTMTLVAVFVLDGVPPVTALLLPLCIVWLMVLTFSLALAASTINVHFRDISSTLPFVLQGLLFLSPIGYPAHQAPPTIAAFLHLNPLTGVIETWRWALLGSEVDPLSFWIAIGWTVVGAVVSWFMFKRLEPKFADVI